MTTAAKSRKTTTHIFATDEQPMPITPTADEPTPELRAAQRAFTDSLLNGGSAKPANTFGTDAPTAPVTDPATLRAQQKALADQIKALKAAEPKAGHISRQTQKVDGYRVFKQYIPTTRPAPAQPNPTRLPPCASGSDNSTQPKKRHSLQCPSVRRLTAWSPSRAPSLAVDW